MGKPRKRVVAGQSGGADGGGGRDKAAASGSGINLIAVFIGGVVATLAVVALISKGGVIAGGGSSQVADPVDVPPPVKKSKKKKSNENLPDCVNKNHDCDYWAAKGECENNPGYMITNCPKACELCESEQLFDPSNRCRKDPNLKPEIPKDGGITQIFTHLTTDPEIVAKFSHLSLTQQRRHNPVIHSTDPWVVTLENFVTEAEANQLLDVVGDGFERSSSAGAKRADGTFERNFNDYRTSHNAWCMGACNNSAVNKLLQQRIADITQTSIQAQESFQVLRYEIGQYYKVHHDYIFDHKDMPCGPRILTAFNYLNDVEEGGGTHFPGLNITVHPKAGMMLLWPSVKDTDHMAIDQRTDHEALPVIKGTKFAANAWIHLYDFRSPNAIGCTG